MTITVDIRRLLLVDDDASIRELAQMGLEGMTKWVIELAASGSEAIEKAKRCPPDVILLDLMMPGMDGMQTLAKLKEDPALSAVPVVLLTAKIQRQEIQRYIDMGVTGVITKPFDPITLSEEVEQIVARAVSV